MSQRTLNFFCTGRDALVHDWEIGAETAMVFAYRVFNTENGYGVAGQIGVSRPCDTGYTILGGQ